MSENEVTDVDVMRGLTADIVSGHIANNVTPAEQIPLSFIRRPTRRSPTSSPAVLSSMVIRGRP